MIALLSLSLHAKQTAFFIRANGKSGIPYLKANVEDCVLADSLKITIDKSAIGFSLGSDTSICQGST